MLIFYVIMINVLSEFLWSTYYNQEGFLMTWSLLFFTTNIFLGIGLAMDAFCFHGKRSEWTTYEQRACMHNCRSIWWISGTYASDWLVLRTHDRGVLSCIWKVYSMDCIDSSSFIGGKMLIEGIKTTAKKKYLPSVQGTVCSRNCHFYRCVICWFYYRRI